MELHCADSLEWMKTQPDKRFALTIGSPPYPKKFRRYHGGAFSKNLGSREWVDWMVNFTIEAVRITSNVVIWVANGCVNDGVYEPACEGLMWHMYQLGYATERPVVWHKNAPPNRRDWFGNDWEYCLAFRPKDSTRAFNWQAIATPPKFKSGGRFSQRDASGNRKVGSEYPQGQLARPRDVLRVTVGGGHLGSKLAHENEAPYPEKIVEPFVLSCASEGELVLDPFLGSGTTAAVARRFGREFVGVDCRQSQIELTQRRLAEHV